MSDNIFTFSYPQDSGFGTSSIHFHSGHPDLGGLFSENGNHPRLFVTDTTIAALDSTKNFVSIFDFQCKDELQFPRAGKHGSDILLILGPGEKYKTLESVTTILETALNNNLNRNCEFVAIGGGVICDMTAFAASMFKRGVDVSFVPTTLLSMVDASIGGKSGCDFKGFKNMIGAFWPAKVLHVWPQFVKSLPNHEYMSGLGEALKTALLFNPAMWDTFSKNKDGVLSQDPQILQTVIEECVKAKAKIVEEDFREHGRRSFLNLGHTFGHALESVAGLGDITHGAAVVWGIGRALDLSEKLGLCTKDYAQETKKVLSEYGYDMESVPQVLKSKSGATEKLIDAMKKDKKNQSSDIRIILQKNLCDTLIQTVPDQDIKEVLK